MIGGRLKFKN